MERMSPAAPCMERVIVLFLPLSVALPLFHSGRRTRTKQGLGWWSTAHSPGPFTTTLLTPWRTAHTHSP
eukprot:11742748-Prorocentrum_lima.AAC.1